MSKRADDLLTPSKAAQIRGCSEKLMRLAIKDGRLKARRVESVNGVMWAIRRGDLMAFEVRARGRPREDKPKGKRT